MPQKTKKRGSKQPPPRKDFIFPRQIDIFPINLAGIWAPAPIHPGDPINVMWRLLSAKTFGLFPDTVSAKIYLDAYDVLLYESGEVPLVAAPDSSFFYTTGDQSAVILSPNQATSNQLYQLGQVALRVEITSKKTGEVFVNTNNLDVVAAQLVGWVWTGAQGTVDTDSGLATPPPLTLEYNFIINHPYQLLGRVTNIATNRGVSVAGTVTILETSEDFSTTTEVQVFPFALQATGATENFESMNITKNWTWIIPGVWVQNPEEPLSKWFNYSVRVSYSDSFANVYPDVVLGQYLSLDILVTAAKKDYGIGALAALAAGAIAGIFSFGIGTAIGQALAAGLGVQAMDPPQPDPRFREAVIPPNEQAGKITTDDRFPALLSFLNSLNTAVETIDALGDIRNRLLGASIAKDRTGIKLQRDSYASATRLLHTIGTRIAAEAATAIDSVKNDKRFNSSSLEQTIRRWQRGGIPTVVRQTLLEQGCTVECMRSLELALNNPTVSALAPNFTRTLELLSFHMLMAISSVERQASSVMRDLQ
jgi:hypothetical protein